MIGHERIAEWINVEKPQSGYEHASEDEYCRHWTATDSSSCQPKRHDHSQRRRGKHVLPPQVVINLPARVKEDEGMRPDELCGVEPQGAPCNQSPPDGRKGPFLPLGADMLSFQPDGVQP